MNREIDLSIVICSQKQELDPKLRSNIDKTIGCSYELIVIDNSENSYSIYEAYNIGIKRSRGNLICFSHEDINIKTQNWGVIVSDFFRRYPKLGLLGIAGAKSKTRSASGWWDCPVKDKLLNIVQHYPDGKTSFDYMGFEDSEIQYAVVIDGVFMVLRKEIDVRFNTKFSGFHGYDLNLSFEVIKRKFELAVTKSILIEHFSYGELNGKWLKTIVDIHESYEDILPLYINEIPPKKREILNIEKIIRKGLNYDKWKIVFLYWLKLISLNPSFSYHIRFIIRKINERYSY